MFSNRGSAPASGISDQRRVTPDRWNDGVHLEALANLAHELRTPVQVLLGYLEMLRDDVADTIGPHPRRILDRMQVNAHDLARTVENVMDFALAPAGAEPPDEEEIVLADLVDEIMPSLEAANDGKHLALNLELAGAPPVIRSRRRPLRTILLNLAVNAVKFTSEGSVAVLIRGLPSRHHCVSLEIEVRDTGPGMDASRLWDALRPCFQLSNSSVRRYRGMGLGLSVVVRNVEALGAELDVTTAPDEGSMFRVRIPLLRESAGTTRG